jgi:hypothetical protein
VYTGIVYRKALNLQAKGMPVGTSNNRASHPCKTALLLFVISKHSLLFFPAPVGGNFAFDVLIGMLSQKLLILL